jgi:hypothetical protein
MPASAILREQVAQAVDDGADLDEVEARVIGPARVSSELHDALWLYAWGLLERDPPLTSASVDAQRFSR